MQTRKISLVTRPARSSFHEREPLKKEVLGVIFKACFSSHCFLNQHATHRPLIINTRTVPAKLPYIKYQSKS
eukprot:scaffold462_cov101-Skeletonema_dohrnii-CCMP3373.AAC.4